MSEPVRVHEMSPRAGDEFGSMLARIQQLRQDGGSLSHEARKQQATALILQLAQSLDLSDAEEED